jgi:NADH dehydrogenase FAD-containing subunit
VKPHSGLGDNDRKTPSKDLVRSYQAAIARHVAEHSRAVGRYQQAVARQDQIVAAQNEALSAARQAVEQTVIGMAGALGVELTAELLEMGSAEVRRLLRDSRSAPGDGSAR